MKSIKYIGHRKTYREGAYGSGIIFTQGETVSVDDDIAVKLLRHKDVYVLGDAEESTTAFAVESSNKKDDDEQEQENQDQRDVIAAMNKDALKAFAKTHFQIDVDSRKSVENIRAQVIGLVDQYGVE
ncbi:MAG: hypothetical protein ACKO0Z_23100 [Betaproteobacteria bacterium]